MMMHSMLKMLLESTSQSENKKLLEGADEDKKLLSLALPQASAWFA
jgi:hypothetical protein